MTERSAVVATDTRVVRADALGEWRADWDELAAAADLPTPFLYSWWLEGTAGRRAHYVLVVRGDRLLGGLALERRRTVVVERYAAPSAGKLCPDHLDLVADPAHVDDVVAALRSWWTAPGWRLLDLEGARGGARVTRALPSARLLPLDVAPYEPLPADGAVGYYAARSRTFNQRVRRWRRQTQARGVTYRRLAEEEIPAAMADFAAMHGVRPDRRRLLRELPRIHRAVRLGAERGEVRLYAAELDGRRGAISVFFVVGGRLCLYQTARRLDPEFNHVGSVLLLTAIEDACADGLAELDFLRGGEHYKFSFASGSRDLVRIAAGHGLGGRGALAALRAGVALRRRAGIVRERIRRSVDQRAARSH